MQSLAIKYDMNISQLAGFLTSTRNSSCQKKLNLWNGSTIIKSMTEKIFVSRESSDPIHSLLQDFGPWRKIIENIFLAPVIQ